VTKALQIAHQSNRFVVLALATLYWLLQKSDVFDWCCMCSLAVMRVSSDDKLSRLLLFTLLSFGTKLRKSLFDQSAKLTGQPC
jgi:hypothetical protein